MNKWTCRTGGVLLTEKAEILGVETISVLHLQFIFHVDLPGIRTEYRQNFFPVSYNKLISFR
jgi:hypothetical protein